MYADAIQNKKRTGVISVLAPRFSSPGLEEHVPLLSVRRDLLVFDGPPRTDLRPTYRMVDDHTNILESEFLVWNLAGCNVQFNLNDGAVLRMAASLTLP